MKGFKTFLFAAIIMLFALPASAQPDIPQLDKSPLDVSYYPANYPMLKAQSRETEPLVAKLYYSRPALNNRKMFGDILPYGQVWRMGANEATEIEFFKNVEIGNKTVRKGRYTMYAIPFTNKWTIILNKDLDIWGSFLYKQEDDVVRVDVPVENNSRPVENLSMYFEKSGEKNINLRANWDSVKVTLPISLH